MKVTVRAGRQATDPAALGCVQPPAITGCAPGAPDALGCVQPPAITGCTPGVPDALGCVQDALVSAPDGRVRQPAGDLSPLS